MSLFEVFLALLLGGIAVASWIAKRALYEKGLNKHYSTEKGGAERDDINERYKVKEFSKRLFVFVLLIYLAIAGLMILQSFTAATIAVALFMALPTLLVYMFIFLAYVLFVHLFLGGHKK